MFGAHVDEAKRKLVEETARRHPFDVADHDKPIPRRRSTRAYSSLFERGDRRSAPLRPRTTRSTSRR